MNYPAWAPADVATLRKRFPTAVCRILNASAIIQGMVDWPYYDAEHVFDFEDQQMRFIVALVSVDGCPPSALLVTVWLRPDCALVPVLQATPDRVEQYALVGKAAVMLLTRICPRRLPDMFHVAEAPGASVNGVCVGFHLTCETPDDWPTEKTLDGE